MPALRMSLLALTLSCAVAGAAALEPNRGQAKAEILFLSRGLPSLAVTAQSVWYSPLAIRMSFVASHPNPAVGFSTRCRASSTRLLARTHGYAGEVTPPEQRLLEYGALVQIAGGPMATVEYAGAAPGLVAGVTQINVKLPDVIPDVEGFPRGTVPLLVLTPGLTYYPGYVTVAVAVD